MVLRIRVWIIPAHQSSIATSRTQIPVKDIRLRQMPNLTYLDRSRMASHTVGR